jgi:hypothetical protein
MTKIEQLQKEHDSAWLEYKKAEASIKPIRDVWLRLAQALDREKVREEIRKESEGK